MEALHQKRLQQMGQRVIEVLNKKGFKAQYAPTKDEALEAALALFTPEASVGLGGSVTVMQLGLKDKMLSRGNKVYDHQGVKGEEKRKVCLAEIGADVFMCSANALTLEGEIVNVDGAGNRLAALCYGPRKIIMLVGANKIVRNEAAARERIKMVAAPLNTARLQCKTPCTSTGMCMECSAPGRICNGTLILTRPMMGAEFHIIVIGESLGF